MSEPLPYTHISRDELEALQLKANQPGGKGLSIQTFTELTREILRLREALLLMRTYAGETYRHWDRDEDHKVGKRLAAMAGFSPGYNEKIDEALKGI